MAMGLLAIVTSVIKLYLLYDFWFHVDPGSYNYNYVKFLIPTWIELFITIIGATVPALNALLMRCMRNCGLLPERRGLMWGLGGRVDLADVDLTQSADKSTPVKSATLPVAEMKW
jgi:hypothetical protein